MKLERLAYDPAAVLEFYSECFSNLGALCERTWHDRLELIAEGPAARLWNSDGTIYSGELYFAPADVAVARDAHREVFPGAPLTFRLAEAMRPLPLPLERVVIGAKGEPPVAAVAEKLWRTQFPETRRWRLLTDFQRSYHFSCLALARCEIQAIDQHWSLHRVAVSLPDGRSDPSLAGDFAFLQVQSTPDPEVHWPTVAATDWNGFMKAALEEDIAAELGEIRSRQAASLKRELDRIDDYFASYERELTVRGMRTSSENVKMKTADRIAASKSEHSRRRADQVARHEIHVHPHVDALLLVAEPAWRAELEVERGHRLEILPGSFIPRARRWGE